ncbi:bifunctional metallophosphatase/5'-nucleotidase [Nocardioides sp.]|uniref:bifunctional metallophosphatase/5'-nucleotidase n=1 Tax=Nocardioides sp. TaxID=35761 RepID=UPI0039E322CB
MPRPLPRNQGAAARRTRLVASSCGLALTATSLSILAIAPAEAADAVSIRLLNINDFHGRIDTNTTAFATTIEQERAEAGEDNTLFLSAGDNVGASLFASSIQDDDPTIDVLNALDLQTSAVGNHEFDKGMDDLTDHIEENADWTYLGANVYESGTTTPAMQEYELFEVDGVTVGVIGAVTEETPSLVSPAGIADLDFGDPVEAVNRVAAELTDGDDSNGEADILVAEYHEGASEGSDESDLDTQVALGTAFADIVNDTSAAVDVIFTGHTHMEYAWDAPVPGDSTKTRPILQTGSYGENVGEVDLTYDPDSDEVTAYAAQNVARVTTADTSYERVAEVDEITTAALAYAAEIGDTPITTITDDVTTAFSSGTYTDGVYTGGTRDNRAAESTLGELVANALRDGAEAFAEVDLGVTNPGGLRAELYYAGDTSSNEANTDGVVTYAEANSVLPYSNTIAVVTLTGAQLKEVLEEQWQPSGSSRPYLQLGLSDNVSVTADATAPEGSRITSVYIDGKPIDDTASYNVSTFSFLAQGGDNFTSFTEGSYYDSGYLDAQLWREYLAANTPISPDYARQQVFESGLPNSVTAGGRYTFTLGVNNADAGTTYPLTGETLDLTSLGSPQNTSVAITAVTSAGETSLGTAAVTNGTATVSLAIPATLTAAGEIELVAQPSGTTVTIPLAASSATTDDGKAKKIAAVKSKLKKLKKKLKKAKKAHKTVKVKKLKKKIKKLKKRLKKLRKS